MDAEKTVMDEFSAAESSEMTADGSAERTQKIENDAQYEQIFREELSAMLQEIRPDGLPQRLEIPEALREAAEEEPEEPLRGASADSLDSRESYGASAPREVSLDSRDSYGASAPRKDSYDSRESYGASAPRGGSFDSWGSGSSAPSGGGFWDDEPEVTRGRGSQKKSSFGFGGGFSAGKSAGAASKSRTEKSRPPKGRSAKGGTQSKSGRRNSSGSDDFWGD